MTRFEKRERRIRRRRCEIVTRCLGAVMAVICAAACLAFLVSGHEYTPQEEKEILEGYSQEPIIRGTPDLEVVDATIDPVGCKDELIVKQSKTAKDSASDTPEEDEADDQFELLCQIVMCEGGYTEPDDGLRAIADGVLNRMDSPLFPNTIAEVVYQEGQFEPVSSGRLWSYVPTERVIQICAEEVQHRTYPEILFWRTGHYHAGTRPIVHIGHHYYSGK